MPPRTPTATSRRHRAMLAASLCLLACLITPDVKSAGTLEPWTATTPPAFSLNDTRGNMHQLEDYLGKGS